ncbi:MAG: PorT family protein [Tannerellaceae bacterium]|nr:PorT family protein [Tannerellaceae bacterium]
MKKNIPDRIMVYAFFYSIQAQEAVRIENKTFNFGATLGLKSGFPVINSLTLDGVEAENIHIQYKVGYLASIFCRINIDRFFFQPSLGWHHTTGEIRFTLPNETDAIPAVGYSKLDLQLRSLKVPVLLGYKFIKEDPYGLSWMVGPKLKYNYKNDYSFDISNSRNRFTTSSNPVDISIVTGIAASIGRLFIDFSYKFGLNRKESDFTNIYASEKTITDISIYKRMNVMSFSLGLLF